MNSLSLTGIERARAEAAVAGIGREPNVRGEALAPEEFVRLAERLA